VSLDGIELPDDSLIEDELSLPEEAGFDNDFGRLADLAFLGAAFFAAFFGAAFFFVAILFLFLNYNGFSVVVNIDKYR